MIGLTLSIILLIIIYVSVTIISDRHYDRKYTEGMRRYKEGMEEIYRQRTEQLSKLDN